jgi:hypothetical protein
VVESFAIGAADRPRINRRAKRVETGNTDHGSQEEEQEIENGKVEDGMGW